MEVVYYYFARPLVRFRLFPQQPLQLLVEVRHEQTVLDDAVLLEL